MFQLVKMVMLGLFLLGLFHFGSTWPSQKIYSLPDFEMCIDTDLKQIEHLKRELFKIIPLEEITRDKKDTSFGLLIEDWDRLDKLAKNLPKDSIMKSRLVNAFRLLIAALYQAHSKPIFQECYGQRITTSKDTYVKISNKTTNNTSNSSRKISKDRHDLDEEESVNWPLKSSITNQTVQKENDDTDNVIAGSDNEETGIVYPFSIPSDSPTSLSAHNNHSDHTSSIPLLSTDGNNFYSTTAHPFDVKSIHDEFSPGSVEFPGEDGTGSAPVSTLSFEEPYSTESYNSSLDLINIQNSTTFQILYGLENATENLFDEEMNETVDLETTSKDFEYSTDAISLFSTAKSLADVKVSHPSDGNTPVNVYSVYQSTENPTSPYQDLSHYDITDIPYQSDSILVDEPTTSYPSYLFSTTANTIDGTQKKGKEIHSDEVSNVPINITEFYSTTPTLPEVIRTYSGLPPSVENTSGIDNVSDENNQTMKTLTSEFTIEDMTPDVFEITSTSETSQVTKESVPIPPNITSTINTTNHFSHDYYTLSSTYHTSLMSTTEITPDHETSTSWTAKSEKTSLPEYFDNSLYDDDEDDNENKNPESRFGFDFFGPEKELSTTAKPKESFKYFTITYKKQSQSHDANKHTNKLKIYPKDYPIKRPQQKVYSSCKNGNHCVRVHDPQHQYPASFYKNDKVPNSDIYYNLPNHIMKRNKSQKRPPKDVEPSNDEGFQWSLNKLSKENTLK